MRSSCATRAYSSESSPSSSSSSSVRGRRSAPSTVTCSVDTPESTRQRSPSTSAASVSWRLQAFTALRPARCSGSFNRRSSSSSSRIGLRPTAGPRSPPGPVEQAGLGGMAAPARQSFRRGSGAADDLALQYSPSRVRARVAHCLLCRHRARMFEPRSHAAADGDSGTSPAAAARRCCACAASGSVTTAGRFERNPRRAEVAARLLTERPPSACIHEAPPGPRPLRSRRHTAPCRHLVGHACSPI